MAAIKKALDVDLGALLDAGDDAIVTLVAGDTRLIAHRAVLAARSPVFASMFGHSTLESSSGQVVIKDVEGQVLRQLVSYLYNLQAPQIPDIAAQLLVAADKYGVAGLKADCERQVVARLSVENAAAAGVLAVRHSCPGLRQAAVAFMKLNFQQVVATQGWADAVVDQPHAVVEFTRLLPEQPAEKWDVSVQDKDRKLIEAAKEGEVEEIQTLLTPAANVGARDEDKMTALHWAAREGQVEAVKCLLSYSTDVDPKEEEHNTPLHLAAWSGHVDVVKLLLASSASPSARCWNGRTPLHDATELGYVEVVSALLQAGTDRGARDIFGETAMDMARRKNNEQLIKMLS